MRQSSVSSRFASPAGRRSIVRTWKRFWLLQKDFTGSAPAPRRATADHAPASRAGTGAIRLADGARLSQDEFARSSRPGAGSRRIARGRTRRARVGHDVPPQRALLGAGRSEDGAQALALKLRLAELLGAEITVLKSHPARGIRNYPGHRAARNSRSAGRARVRSSPAAAALNLALSAGARACSSRPTCWPRSPASTTSRAAQGSWFTVASSRRRAAWRVARAAARHRPRHGRDRGARWPLVHCVTTCLKTASRR